MYSDRRRFSTDLVRVFATAVGIWVGGVLCVPALAQEPAQNQPYSIEAGDLAESLDRFAEQNRLQIIYNPDILTGKSAPAINGAYSAEAVLSRLLSGTGLEWEFVNDKTVVVRSPKKTQGADAGVAAGAVGTQSLAADESPVAAGASTGFNEGGVTTAESVDAAKRQGIEEIIVTGQKKEERIQDVPIAISAFSMEKLDNQKIEGGFDLLKAVPNVTFSKSNFTGYNFQIRGIGTQAISATTDPGVAVSFNNTTLIVNRLFEQEYLDIERVEVLRGPQGTLFGRNATAGVINVITAKPEMGVTTGEFKIEGGNYASERFRGHINWAFTDTVAARAAFATTRRDGFGRNLAAADPEIQDFILKHDRDPISDNIDNRDLWTGRFSLGWQPSDRFRANLIYERFEEDDKRMRSTKQLCHYADGNITLHDNDGNPITVRETIDRAEDAGGSQLERNIQTRFLSQLSQGCLPGSLFDKGNLLSSDPNAQGAYGTPNANAMPFLRAGRGGSFVIHDANAPALSSYPDCEFRSPGLVTECILDPMASQHGQSRDMRDIFSMIDPKYEATSELFELSFDYDVSDGLRLSSQTVYMENKLFSTQDFLRFKTLPTFNDSSAANMLGGNNIRHRRLVTPSGVFDDPQLGKSDRLLMQDVSQLDTRQLSQELRLVSNFDGPLNYSVGANYTHFENTADYFVFINMLSALAQVGEPYVAPITDYTTTSGEQIRGVWTTVSCGRYYAETYIDEGLPEGRKEVGRCVHVQQGGIDEVRADPQGHNFFMSRNPFELNSAGLFGEVYYEFTPTVKLTAGLRVNWDRKSFTPIPSQTLLADWRGRVEGPAWADPYRPLPPDADMRAICDPRSPTRWEFSLRGTPCALGGMAAYGRGYPSLPDIVQEWRVPTGRIGIDWKADFGLSWVDESLVYAFYTRGYKAGGANPPVQSPPSGIMLEAAQGVTSPRVFEAEYVNAFEIGSKNRLFGSALTLNGTAFYYDYSDYQVSKIVDRTAVNENVDATVWGLELETVFAPAPDTLFNAAIGYLHTRIADGVQSLDLMDRTQGGNHRYVDPGWASVDCEEVINARHMACIPALDADGDPLVIDGDPVYLYRDGFDEWVVVRPTITQASSCVAPAVLIYRDVYRDALGNSTMVDDELSKYCPAGQLTFASPYPGAPGGATGYSPFTSAPNGGAGFLADIGGNELPNAPRFTVSLGAQQTIWLPIADWSATTRVDWYWQDKSFHRVYNTEYDRLKAWTNTNLSFWVANDRLGLTIEAYVKNIFNETPVTGAFMNSDDTGLSTNVFTLDPRLIGLSVRKRF